jgi:hypothetical protein
MPCRWRVFGVSFHNIGREKATRPLLWSDVVDRHLLDARMQLLGTHWNLCGASTSCANPNEQRMCLGNFRHLWCRR